MKRWDEILRRLPPRAECSAAEVGVWKGQLSERLLKARPRLTLYLVDLWLPGTSNTSWLASGSTMAQQPAEAVQQIRRRVEQMAARYGQRARIIAEASASAARHVDDGSLDLVFIDADHSQLAVLADIQAWRSKVKPGGLIGGHDYGKARFSGVADAVHLSFQRDQVELGEDSTWWVRL